MALSQDGVKLRKGMKVVVLIHNVSWNKWMLTDSRVVDTSRHFSSVLLAGAVRWLQKEDSESQVVYVDPIKAVAEIRRRNKLASKKK